MTNHPVNPSDDAPDEPPRRTPGGIESWLAGAWIGALVAVIIIVAFMAGRDHGASESTNKAAAPPAKTAGGSAPAATTETTATATATTEQPAAGGAASSGKEIFATTCGGCHTLAAAGTSGAVGPNLDQLKPDLALVEKAIKIGGTGNGAMPPGLLQGADATAVAKFVSENAGK